MRCCNHLDQPASGSVFLPEYSVCRRRSPTSAMSVIFHYNLHSSFKTALLQAYCNTHHLVCIRLAPKKLHWNILEYRMISKFSRLTFRIVTTVLGIIVLLSSSFVLLTEGKCATSARIYCIMPRSGCLCPASSLCQQVASTT